MSEGSHPTRGRVLVRLVVDEVLLQMVKRDRLFAWREVQGMEGVQLGSPCLIVCLE